MSFIQSNISAPTTTYQNKLFSKLGMDMATLAYLIWSQIHDFLRLCTSNTFVQSNSLKWCDPCHFTNQSIVKITWGLNWNGFKQISYQAPIASNGTYLWMWMCGCFCINFVPIHSNSKQNNNRLVEIPCVQPNPLRWCCHRVYRRLMRYAQLSTTTHRIIAFQLCDTSICNKTLQIWAVWKSLNISLSFKLNYCIYVRDMNCDV